MPFNKETETDNHIKITRWFEKSHSGCKNLNDWERQSRLKTMDSETVLQSIEGNPTISAGHPMGFLTFSTSVKGSSAVELRKNIAKILTYFNTIKIKYRYRSPGRVIPETGVQSLVESYQKLKKWYLMLSCLTLCIIRYASRVKWSNLEKGVAPPLHLGVVAIEKEAFVSPSTTVANYFIYSSNN